MRKIPRSFKMPFGSGMIVEEVSITSKYHEPTIQLLKFDNGDKVLLIQQRQVQQIPINDRRKRSAKVRICD